MSVLLAGILVVSVAATLSAAGFLVVSKTLPERWRITDMDVAGMVYTTVGMVYAIVIAVAAIAVWEPRSDAGQSSDREATDLVQMYWDAQALPESERSHVQRLVKDYAATVVSQEWPALREQRTASAKAETLFTQLRTSIQAFEPSAEEEKTARRQLADRSADAFDARRARIAAADSGMPQLVWPILVLGGLVMVGFLWLFGLGRSGGNVVMMATVGAMVAVLLFVLYQIEFPFSRGLSVPPDAFESAVQYFTKPI